MDVAKVLAQRGNDSTQGGRNGTICKGQVMCWASVYTPFGPCLSS